MKSVRVGVANEGLLALWGSPTKHVILLVVTVARKGSALRYILGCYPVIPLGSASPSNKIDHLRFYVPRINLLAVWCASAHGMCTFWSNMGFVGFIIYTNMAQGHRWVSHIFLFHGDALLKGENTAKTRFGSYLVGGWTNPSEKYMSNWIISPNRDEHKQCLKPLPTA